MEARTSKIEDYEIAARKYCEERGIDPDRKVFPGQPTWRSIAHELSDVARILKSCHGPNAKP